MDFFYVANIDICASQNALISIQTVHFLQRGAALTKCFDHSSYSTRMLVLLLEFTITEVNSIHIICPFLSDNTAKKNTVVKVKWNFVITTTQKLLLSSSYKYPSIKTSIIPKLYYHLHDDENWMTAPLMCVNKELGDALATVPPTPPSLSLPPPGASSTTAGTTSRWGA